MKCMANNNNNNNAKHENGENGTWMILRLKQLRKITNLQVEIFVFKKKTKKKKLIGKLIRLHGCVCVTVLCFGCFIVFVCLVSCVLCFVCVFGLWFIWFNFKWLRWCTFSLSFIQLTRTILLLLLLLLCGLKFKQYRKWLHKNKSNRSKQNDGKRERDFKIQWKRNSKKMNEDENSIQIQPKANNKAPAKQQQKNLI